MFIVMKKKNLKEIEEFVKKHDVSVLNDSQSELLAPSVDELVGGREEGCNKNIGCNIVAQCGCINIGC